MDNLLGKVENLKFSYTLPNNPLLIIVGVFSNNKTLIYVQRTYTSNCSRSIYAQIYTFMMHIKPTYPYLHLLHFPMYHLVKIS